MQLISEYNVLVYFMRDVSAALIYTAGRDVAFGSSVYDVGEVFCGFVDVAEVINVEVGGFVLSSVTQKLQLVSFLVVEK